MKMPFRFINPGKLVDDDLKLVLVKKTPVDPVTGYSPCYHFEMRRCDHTGSIGIIRLRIDSTAKMRYPGHIGYEVKPRFRGHRYAARSCRLVLPLARDHRLQSVWLTVDPKNIPSQKTCKIISAEYIETVRIPKDHEMYREGARYRRRYRLSLQK